MSDEIRFSKSGFFLGVGVVACCFGAVIVLGIVGAFCPRPVPVLATTATPEPIKAAEPDMTPEAEANWKARQADDDKTKLYIEDQRILDCFHPINGLPRLKWQLSFDDGDDIGGRDAYKQTDLNAKLFFMKNTMPSLSGIELTFSRDLRRLGEADQQRLVRLGTAWQQLCSTISPSFDGVATKLFLNVLKGGTATASTASPFYKLDYKRSVSPETQLMTYSFTVSRVKK